MWTKEQALTIDFLMSMLEIVPNVDKFNTWMLAGTGATAGLMVSNLEPIISSVGRQTTSWLLASLAISALLGFLAKFHGIRAQNAKVLFHHIIAALQNNQDTDIEAALNEFLASFPAWVRRAMKSGARRGATDPLFGFKKAVNYGLNQAICTVVQGLSFVVFITIAALCVN